MSSASVAGLARRPTHCRVRRCTPPLLICFLLSWATLTAGSMHTLLSASRDGLVNDVVRIVASGTSIDAREEESPWRTSLMVAAARRRVAVVKQLLLYGAQAKLRDGQAQTALMHAALVGLPESVELILKAGGAEGINYQDANGDTALHLAAGRGHLAVTQLLIDAGADVNLTSHACTTAFQAAIIGCNPEVGPIRALHSVAAPPCGPSWP